MTDQERNIQGIHRHLNQAGLYLFRLHAATPNSPFDEIVTRLDALHHDFQLIAERIEDG